MARRIKTRKKQSKQEPTSNPDFRSRTNFPLPSVEEIERRLRLILKPGGFATRQVKAEPGKPEPKKLRDRLLTLPVMAVLVVSLVWRQIPSLSEALRLIAFEGLWEIEPFEVSRQALSKRLMAIPAQLFAQMYEEALELLRESEREEPPSIEGSLQARFTALWAADGSTLEALRRKLKELREGQTPLGGKMMAVVDLFTRGPRHTWYTPDSKANDKTFCDQLLEALPVGGLVVLDLGWFSFPLFDKLTESGKYFLTRLRNKTSYKVVEVLGANPHWRDEIIEMGAHRSNPCKHRVRMVSVLWGATWYYYLTNVLDPNKLSTQEVCQLYRKRWRIEEAFLLTKRLLALSYLWVGGSNGVEIQLYATWLFYAVLSDLCVQIAQALDEPVERISVEMVFRSLYHFSRAIDRGENPELIQFLVQHAVLLGLVKAKSKRQKEKEALELEIWGKP